MQFSDVSGGLGLVQNAEFLTGIGPAQISGNAQNLKDFTRLANLHYHLIDTMILESVSGFDYDDSNKTDYPIVTADLTANRQDYLLPTKTLRVKRVEVKMDGSTWQ